MLQPNDATYADLYTVYKPTQEICVAMRRCAQPICGDARCPATMLMQNASSRFRLAREGKGWIAVAPGFVSLETSPFGYALTQDEAIAHLLASADYQRLAESQGWSCPSSADFIEVAIVDDEPPRARAAPYGVRLVFSR